MGKRFKQNDTGGREDVVAGRFVSGPDDYGRTPEELETVAERFVGEPEDITVIPAEEYERQAQEQLRRLTDVIKGMQ